MTTIASIKRLDLRSVWKNEAHDFTPWLVENIEGLGEALGMELEVLHREAAVGAFSLDILAKDIGRDRTVIIENQLEATNHDHLGKLLTYAAGHDASAVVWVAKEIREEHRQTLDWLNQHTDSNIEFYAVMLEVLQIDDSRPAFNFRPVVFPNEWRKSRVDSSGASGTSEKQEAYRAFFQDLIDTLREKHHFTGARKGQPQSWYSFACGLRSAHFSACFVQDSRVRAEIYLDTGSADTTKALFDNLHGHKAQIEKLAGEELTWERLDERRASRISILRAGSIEDDETTLADIQKWLVEKLLRLKKVVDDKSIRQILQQAGE